MTTTMAEPAMPTKNMTSRTCMANNPTWSMTSIVAVIAVRFHRGAGLAEAGVDGSEPQCGASCSCSSG